jgi:DNA (cytosine-5)-methyltransferase 1
MTTGHQGDRVVPENHPFPTLPAQGGNNGGGPGALLQPRESPPRRLTPVECERLQGFDDGHTCLCIPLDKWVRDPEGCQERCRCPDGPRYKALGNAITVNTARWLGGRIKLFHQFIYGGAPPGMTIGEWITAGVPVADLRKPTVGSLFTGIGGADRGLELAGWEIRWQVERDPEKKDDSKNSFAQEVLRRHWRVPLYDDITQIDGKMLEPVDLVCGGFPCQDLSVAGRRAGFEGGERSVLFFQITRIVAEMTARPWLLLENVPGLLTSNKGRDLAAVVGALINLGYAVQYRVLDSRYFGVPQRRRRVFILAYPEALGVVPVLFECGEHAGPQRRKVDRASHAIAPTVTQGVGAGMGQDLTNSLEAIDAALAFQPETKGMQLSSDVAATLRGSRASLPAVTVAAAEVSHPLLAAGARSERGVPIVVAPTFTASHARATGTTQDKVYDALHAAMEAPRHPAP